MLERLFHHVLPMKCWMYHWKRLVLVDQFTILSEALLPHFTEAMCLIVGKEESNNR